MKKLPKTIIISSIFLAIGLLIGLTASNSNKDCSAIDLNYIDNQLNCGEKIVVSKQSYASLKSKVEDFIEKKKTEKKVSEVSIYFRDMQNGPTLGVNEHELFSPASLLKLPLLLAYENLKNDKYPDLFSREVVAKTSDNIPTQKIDSKQSIEYGEFYTIESLLERMIKYSDNKSYYVLLDYLRQVSPDEDLLKQTFVDLGIIDPKDLLDNTISVKSYGSIFVQLFNSSYFTKQETSDEVLTMLSKVDWKNGINAGLPPGIEVAHKFGERFGFLEGVVQLHDCGIVYYPGNPYLLCVMTRGYDFDTLSNVIGEISKMFYEEFDSRKI